MIEHVITLLGVLFGIAGVAWGVGRDLIGRRHEMQFAEREHQRRTKQNRPIVRLGIVNEVNAAEGQHLAVAVTNVGGPAPTSMLAIRVAKRVYVGQPAFPAGGGSGLVRLPLFGVIDKFEPPIPMLDEGSEFLAFMLRDVDGNQWDGLFDRPWLGGFAKTYTAQGLLDWSRSRNPGQLYAESDTQPRELSRPWWHRILHLTRPPRMRAGL